VLAKGFFNLEIKGKLMFEPSIVFDPSKLELVKFDYIYIVLLQNGKMICVLCHHMINIDNLPWYYKEMHVT
jgi:hypothetical protein